MVSRILSDNGSVTPRIPWSTAQRVRGGGHPDPLRSVDYLFGYVLPSGYCAASAWLRQTTLTMRPMLPSACLATSFVSTDTAIGRLGSALQAVSLTELPTT